MYASNLLKASSRRAFHRSSSSARSLAAEKRRKYAASVGVDGQLLRRDVLRGEGVGDEPLGQLFALAGGDHPADGVAAVDVEDRIQVVEVSLAWSA